MIVIEHVRTESENRSQLAAVSNQVCVECRERLGRMAQNGTNCVVFVNIRKFK